MNAGGMNVSKKRKKKKPLSKNEKILWMCSLFVSMLFLFGNFQSQHTFLDVILLLGITVSLLFLPLKLFNKLFIVKKHIE